MTLARLFLTFMLIVSSLSIKASEEDLYDFLWLDPDKKVYVLQNKVFKKKGSIYGSLGYVFGLSGNYQNTKGFKMAAGYYFHEEWAVEGMYQTFSNSDNDDYTNLQRINQSVPFLRRPNNAYGVLAIYSPFYGKINTFNKIFYFDWSFGIGLGKISTESNSKTVTSATTADQFEKEDYTNIITKSSLKFHVTPQFFVEAEYMRHNFRAPGAVFQGNDNTKWRSHTSAVLSVGFSF